MKKPPVPPPRYDDVFFEGVAALNKLAESEGEAAMQTWGLGEISVAANTLAETVLAYDDAIRACANDPARMASFCTATGEDLDDLHFAMVERALALLGRHEEIKARRADGSLPPEKEKPQ